MEANVIEEPCTSCGLEFQLDADMRCAYCRRDQAEKVLFRKQRMVFDFLDRKGYSGHTTDRQVSSGECGFQRPDRVFECPDRVVIVEVDENQHKERVAECELIRMFNVSQYYGGRPVIWIRFNPDEYHTTDEMNLPVEFRMDMLLYVIIEAIQTCPLDAYIKVTYLYYDGWNSVDRYAWRVLQAWHTENTRCITIWQEIHTHLLKQTAPRRKLQKPRPQRTDVEENKKEEEAPVITPPSRPLTEYEQKIAQATSVPESFIVDYFNILEKSRRSSDKYIVDIEEVVKMLGSKKPSLSKTLIESYKLDVDYVFLQPTKNTSTGKDPRGGHNYIKTLLTFECFKSIYMASRSKNARSVRNYIIEIEKAVAAQT